MDKPLIYKGNLENWIINCYINNQSAQAGSHVDVTAKR